MIGIVAFDQLLALRGVTVRATKVLSEQCVQWLRARNVPVELLKTGRPCYDQWRGEGHEWLCNGQWHRENDLPAVVWADGRQAWYQNGQLHRGGQGPALGVSDAGAEGTKGGHSPR